MVYGQHNLSNFEDYSSGRVIYGGVGATNFPVRLSNQIFQLCVDILYTYDVRFNAWLPDQTALCVRC
jgi:hypothetical protein